jgi:hypothetical protein
MLKIKSKIWAEKPCPEAAFSPEKSFLHGKNFFGKLLPDLSWSELLFFHLPGRLPTSMNFGGLLTALLKDFGYSRSDLEAFSRCFTIVNFLGVFREHTGSSAPLGPISCTDIEYSGTPLEE